MSLLEEELGSCLTLSSLKGRQSSFISFQRIRKQRDGKREKQRETEIDVYSGGWLLFFCQQQMPDTVVSNRAHFKTQHSCRLCIWAPDRKTREERREKQRIKREKTGNKEERARESDCAGRNRGNTREEREEETKADTDNIYQRSTNKGWVYHYK